MICILLPTEVSHFTKEEIKKSKDSPKDSDNLQLIKNFHLSSCNSLKNSKVDGT